MIAASRHGGGVVLLRTVPLVFMALITLVVFRSVWLNPNFQWTVVGQYLFSPIILRGLGMTCLLTVLTMVAGIVIGVLLAFSQISGVLALSAPARAYVWVFRGTPQLVQLLFWYNLAALYPQYSLGIPFLAPHLLHGSVNDLITPMSAAVLGLGLNEGAYMTEIVRSGLASVGRGQMEAARALGLGPFRIMRRIIMPQAMPVILPPTGNQVAGMLKATSLVSVIALTDLLYAAQSVYSRNYQTIPLLVVACIWYLTATTVVSCMQRALETRVGRHKR
ncbi:amino acid ABC transporter permease (plasmid) [Lichenicola cladoniae]|uniref:Glutamate/aspartate import permease protein GltK n=1 Tax=Lichenicola cladoniae TaxID=1484109 RepID=A0A6M8HWU0_9PROT|nr:amino acid ABC transporter permease [Lichenicola cladoniae]NPD68662.1 amino acid ABC transporter permease [Acetobacteraceae bacterium]QKE93044.1 amino acid ABC transporter permease [Lichenicola cladoniae]